MIQFEPSFLSLYLQGLSFTLVLIISLGAQNVYILKQGLQGGNVLLIIFICIFSDLLFIGAGAFFLSLIESIFMSATLWIYLLGALFLFIYGGRCFLAMGAHDAFHLEHDVSSEEASASVYAKTVARGEDLWKIILPTLAITYLNPHFYIDTFFLIGGRVASYHGVYRLIFFLGCMSASFFWFFSLGYGSRFLAPLFQKPITWRWLNFFIGLFMWGMGWSFLREVIIHWKDLFIF